MVSCNFIPWIWFLDHYLSYRSEFDECVEDLSDETDRVVVDTRVDQAEDARSFGY